MKQSNDSTSAPQRLSLGKRMLWGAWIGLVVIAVFLIPSNNPTPPEWGSFWMIRPLIVVPFAGAMGGLCNYYILTFHQLVGLNRIVAIVISVLVSVIGLWMGIVLGLDGTMWD
jgi:hypothetical protein